MPAIKLTAFIGEQPRIKPRLLPENAAQAAFNVRLDDGGLTPLRLPVQLDEATVGHKTIYRHGDEWLSWDGIVHAAPGPVADDRLYFTGDGPPKLRVEGNNYPLAVARPETALSAALSGTGSGDVVTRTYVYTWVTAFGEESEPSPASTPVDWQPGKTLTLSGFGATPTGRNITKQRIYRSQTGQQGTYFYFIAERDASTSDFVDTVAVDAFAEPLPSADWNAPPDALEGLTVLPNGMMAAFVGRDLYFCEPYRPHAWPEKYVQTTETPIVGLGALGNSLIIMTEAQPYLASGTTPLGMVMTKIEQNLPCINGRGIADVGFAICYPTHEGLVAVTADGGTRLVTASLFDRDKWQALSPSTMIGAQHRGAYVGFYDTTNDDAVRIAGALLLEVGDAPFLRRTSIIASAAFYDVAESSLCYLAPGSADILRFDPPTGQREQMYWRSKPFHLPVPLNFGAILVEADAGLTGAETEELEAAIAAIIAENEALLAAGTVQGEINAAPLNAVPFAGDVLAPIPSAVGTLQIGVYADGKRVAQITRTNVPTRLPSGFKAMKWEIDVSGNVGVTQILMGTTMEDLRQIA